MDKVAKVIKWAIVASVIIYAFGISYIFFFSVHSFAEMDWNEDDQISVWEVVHSLEVGKRFEQEDKQSCLDYFSYKDGSTIKTHCWPKDG